jgi:hypothetical protein
MLGREITCPQCGAVHRVPQAAAVTAAAPNAAKPVTTWQPTVADGPAPGSIWEPRGAPEPATPKRRRHWKWLALLLVFLLPIAAVTTMVLLPLLEPGDPRGQVARRYVRAVQAGDWAEAGRLSVLTAHPRFEQMGDLQLGDERAPVRGKINGLAEFHARIAREYTYVPERKRFELKDPMGLGLGVLSNLEKAKKDVEQRLADQASKPGRRGSVDDQVLDDVIARYGAIGDLTNNLLSAQKLGPTYEDLLRQCDVPLTAEERLLAESFAADPEKWDRLLGRSFLTLPAGAEFMLQWSDVQLVTRAPGKSLTEPGQTVTLELLRFTIGIIDTRWRVWEVR